MNYVVYYESPYDDEPYFIRYATLEAARQYAASISKTMPGVDVYIAQKTSTFISEVTIKET
jgi:hypothetical protein